MSENSSDHRIHRRRFLKLSAATVGGVGTFASESANPLAGATAGEMPVGKSSQARKKGRAFNSEYSGEFLNHVAFPLGGIGAGMLCLEATGGLSHVSLRNRPELFNEPCVFAAISIKGKRDLARVLEGPVPARQLFGPPGTANGAGGTTYGLPRFASATFKTRFPFGILSLSEREMPLQVTITGWSPFEPGDPDNSSLPVAGLEYHFTNRSRSSIEAVFSFNARNFMAIGQNPNAVRPLTGGF